jgi:hemerythrin-like domain-containing protein
MHEQHPVDPLMMEHQLILAVLEAMESKVEQARDGGPFDAAFWQSVAEFLGGYADHWHHGKEEDLLFPAMVACGMPEEGGPIAVMKDEHVIGREHRAGIADGAAAADERKTYSHALAFVELLRGHIGKEDHILYEMARRMLADDDTDRLLAAYAEFESREGGDDTRASHRALAESLCGSVGVDVDRQRDSAPSCM